jgi:hypothetical protein
MFSEMEQVMNMKSTNEPETTISVAQKQRIGSRKLVAEEAPRWAALIGILAVGVLYLFYPERFIIGPSWLLLAIELIALLPLAYLMLTRRRFSHIVMHVYALVLLGIVTLALAVGVALLIYNLPREHAPNLLRSAGLLWPTNIIVFALWYWEIDGGGPTKRHLAGHQADDFKFPQQANGNDGSWAPHFLDYLFVAFTGATALSPTDTFPLTRQAKTLMMIEAMISLTVIVLIAARAVNILGS